MRESVKLITFFRGKLKLKQPKDHRVSVDTVIFLSRLKGINRSKKVVDLGAGFGFLALSVAKKYRCRVWAVERDDLMFELLVENIKLNSLEDLVIPLKEDIRDLKSSFRRDFFEAVVTNPPFFPKNYGGSNPYHFETDTTLKDFVEISSYLLKDGSFFNVIVPFFRTAELFLRMEEFNLPPRYMTVVYPEPGKPSRFSIVSSVKNVRGPLEGDKAIFITDGTGKYTDTTLEALEAFL